MPDGKRLRGITGQRLVRALEKMGWHTSEVSGKHFALEHPGESRARITVPIHGGRELPVKTVLTIIKRAGLTAEELEELL